MEPTYAAYATRSRALVLARPEASALELTERSLTRGPAEAVVRVRHAGICGTDLHIVSWNDWAARRYAPPVILGHEFCGEVVDIDKANAPFRIGDRVVAETHLACGTCRQCRAGRGHTCLNLKVFSKLGQGCFADFTAVPVALLRRVPKGISDSTATLMEPLGIAVRAVAQAHVVGAHVLVTGCGPIGLMMIAVARVAGAARIIASDPVAFRRSLAQRMGADAALDPRAAPLPEAVRDLTSSDGVDAAFDASGHAGGITDALASVAPGGTLVLTGLPERDVAIDLAGKVILREVTIGGVYGRVLDRTWLQVESLLESGRIDLSPLITHHFPLSDFAAAFATAAAGQAGKVIFNISGEKGP